MSQTLTILNDGLRRLRARKIFWLAMVLTILVAASQATVGINEQGLTFLGYQLDTPMLSTAQMSPEAFYKLMFTNVGLSVWLSWIATILALISTAGIFPDLMAGGTIDLVLAKPIGRLRLMLTEYVGGLLFVTLQVAVFTGISILIIGIRGGAWEPGLLLAIPIVVAFFSFLFCVCVGLGVLTRSTVAALLLTIGFWFGLYVLNSVDSVLINLRAEGDILIERRERAIADMESALEQTAQTDTDGESRMRPRLENHRRELTRQRDQQATIERIHKGIVTAKTFLPKTGETIDLLERVLVSTAELPGFDEDDFSEPQAPGDHSIGYVPQSQLQQRVVAMTRARSVWWILGTSLAFEVVVLGGAAWIFCRRDF